MVTGFLGAGKTTFLKNLLPLYRGEKIALIVNEFGKVSVDGPLLSDLGAVMREVTGGSVFCSCRLDQFESALAEVTALHPGLIVVEASGLSDPTAVRVVLAGFPDIAYMGCVALCDAPRVEAALATARVSAKQLAVSDLILLNKTDLVTGNQIADIKKLLSTRFPKARLEETKYGRFLPEWLDNLGDGAQAAPFSDSRDLTLQKAAIQLDEKMTRAQCASFLKLFVEETYRVKGFLKLADESVYVDCVGPSVSMEPCAPALCNNLLVALAGEGMPLRQSLKRARAWYPDLILGISYD